jgi:SPOR domain
MADRYQDRPFPSDGFGRGGDPHGAAEADPLAELARLIGQTDVPGRSSAPRGAPPRQQAAPQPVDPGPAGPPSWMQRANRQEVPRNQQREAPPVSVRTTPLPQRPAPGDYREASGFQDEAPEQDFDEPNFPEQDFASQQFARQEAPRQSFPNQEFADDLAKLDFGVNEPRQRFAAPHPQAEPDAHDEPAFDDEHEPDQSRYDDALFGQLGPATQDYQGEQEFQDDQFGYQDGYDEAEEEEAPKRRSGMTTVVAILALAVVGTGGAFAYKSYFSTSRNGEPPIIKADNSPTKIMASPADSAPKVPDRLLGGDGSEKLVSREETPVDLSRSAGGPRVVFPQLNQNGNPPPPSSVSTNNAPPAPASSNGIMPNGDPRPIKTLSVGGNTADASAAPAAPPPPTRPTAAAAKAARGSPANANASANNAPLALTPQQPAVPVPARVATATPVEPTQAAGSGGYLVSISSQNSEAEAITSYQAVQSKYTSVLGSYTPVIKQVNVAGGVKYRAAVGPFASKEEANKMCGTLKTAGGQCFPFSNQ